MRTVDRCPPVWDRLHRNTIHRLHQANCPIRRLCSIRKVTAIMRLSRLSAIGSVGVCIYIRELGWYRLYSYRVDAGVSTRTIGTDSDFGI